MRLSILSEFLAGLAARPFLPAASALAAGIAVAEVSEGSLSVELLSLLFVSWLLLAGLLYHRGTGWLALALLAGAFGLGFLSNSLTKAPHVSEDSLVLGHLERSVTLEATLAVAVERRRNDYELQLETVRYAVRGEAARPCQGRVLLHARRLDAVPLPGDRLSVAGRLQALSTKGNPGEFDYPAYLLSREIVARLELGDPSRLKILPAERDSRSWRQTLERVRGRLAQRIESLTRPDASRVIAALTLGMQKGLPDNLMKEFQLAGTAHILSISGLHLGVIALLVFTSIRAGARRSPWLLRRASAAQAAAATTLPVVWLYALLAGLSIATLRAAVMITVFLTARFLWRRAEALNSLFIAAFLILLAVPHSLFETGFQLSFLSVLAILLGLPRLTALLPFGMQNYLAGASWHARLAASATYLLAGSLLCLLFNLPVLLSAFHRLGGASPILNLLIVPPFTFLLIPLLGLALLAAFLGLPGASLGFKLGAWLFDVLRSVQQGGLELLGEAVWAPSLPGAVWVIYYASRFFLGLALLPPWGLRGRPRGKLWDDRFFTRTLAAFGLLMFLLAASLAWRALARPERPEGLLAVIPASGNGPAVFVWDEAGSTHLLTNGRHEPSQTDEAGRLLAPMLWSFGLAGLDHYWFGTKAPAERRLARALQGLVTIENGHEDEEGLDCRDYRSLRRCGLASGDTEVFRYEFPAPPEETGTLRLFEFREKRVSLYVVPQPYRFRTVHWALAGLWRARQSVVVVFLGPGSEESFHSMTQILRPVSAVLALNPWQGRRLRQADWQSRLAMLPSLRRSDHDGALRLADDGSVQALGRTWTAR